MKIKGRIRKYVITLLAILFVCTICLSIPNQSGEILQNSIFNDISSDGIPNQWHVSSYHGTKEKTNYNTLLEYGPNRENVLYIQNTAENDSRFYQEVSVEPNSIYCLSGSIKAKCEGGWGANLSVENIPSSSKRLYDTEGKWEQVSFYGKTGEDQTRIKIYARLGGYSGESVGEAWFTNLSLVKVNSIPLGASVQNLYLQEHEEDDMSQPDLRNILLAFITVLILLTIGHSIHSRTTKSLLGIALVAMGAFLCFLYSRKDTVHESTLAYLLWIISIIGFFTLIVLLWMNRKKHPFSNMNVSLEQKHEFNLDIKDICILTTICILYGCLNYMNLGSMKSPQTFFVFEKPGDYVVFDLGKQTDNFDILYMGGIHTSDHTFSIQTSEDNAWWNEETNASMEQGQLFKWLYANNKNSQDCSFSGRYVRLTSQKQDLTLYEVVFRDENGLNIPVQVLEAPNGQATALVDEAFSLEGEPSWYNSMYFDEIYHARTGYEFVRGIFPYETTHPPLGKVIISCCIRLWGMTPFGWRFAGATCGLLMLPGMYLMGKLLFSRRRYAILACLLLTFDTMHFTQTRIATIDSFVVLFIIWSFCFMFRWFYADTISKPLKYSLPWLALSGLFMGLAVASKWTGCFAGLGLAVIFFWGIWKKARRIHIAKNKEISTIGNRRILLTVASCLLFFIIIPSAIYYLSYIPYCKTLGGVSIENVISSAEFMFRYHARDGLGADHPFVSPWYRWLFSEKPMYYYEHQYLPQGYTHSIFAFGNYAVWWVGFVMLLCTVFIFFVKKVWRPMYYSENDNQLRVVDDNATLILVSYAAQLLPWIAVTRGTYIYHYFPSIPFLILSICYVFQQANQLFLNWSVKKRIHTDPYQTDRIFLWAILVYLIIVAAFFVSFFPLASGVTVPREWMDAINWFDNFYY